MREYVQRQQASVNDSQPKASQQASAKEILQAYKKRIIQMQAIDEDELLQGKFEITQRETVEDEELIQTKPNNTGLPDNLKSGIENLSGYSMDDVRVHYNSPKPAQLQALAYTQGTDIHVAPGQEQHLPHETWHVVQQMQGRVQPTTQLQGVNINDNEGLEKEADVMGGKVIQKTSLNNVNNYRNESINNSIVQRKEMSDIIIDIKKIMDENKLNKNQIIEGLKKLDKNIFNDINFPRALVEFIKERNVITNFSIEDLTSEPEMKFGKKHYDKEWTFRHYTNKEHESLRSLADLEANDVHASKNTNDRDWEELGNQGYVFGLIAINGQVPPRTWLSQFEYYAEYNLKKLSNVWVSGDMLSEEGRKRSSYQGSGDTIVKQLSMMLGFQEQNLTKAVDDKFGGTLEAKVPPGALSKPDWKKTS